MALQGVRQVKESDLNPVYLFISPPTMEELEKRLRNRGTDSEEAVQKRLKAARDEILYARTGAHDIVIVNDNADDAYVKFIAARSID